MPQNNSNTKSIEKREQVPKNPEELAKVDHAATEDTQALLSMDELNGLLGTGKGDYDLESNYTGPSHSAKLRAPPGDVTKANLVVTGSSTVNQTEEFSVQPKSHRLDFFSRQPKVLAREGDGALGRKPANRSQPGAFNVIHTGVANPIHHDVSMEIEIQRSPLSNIQEPSAPAPAPAPALTPYLVEAAPINDEPSEKVLQQAQLVDLDQRRTRNNIQGKRPTFLLVAIIGSFIVIAAVVVGVVLGMGIGEAPAAVPAEKPSVEPSEYGALELFKGGALDLLILELPDHTLANLQNIDTPQWKAMDWLSMHRNITHLPEWRKKQLFALATFFFASDGDIWYDDSRRMDDTINECLWFSGQGIDGKLDGHNFKPCNNDGKFQMLYMKGLQLSTSAHELPAEIALLNSLLVLGLPFNKISSPFSAVVPTELYQLTNLTVLDLQAGSMRGTLPSELGLLTALTELMLAENYLSGSLPSELALMTSMERLHLNNNRFSGFSGSLPKELGRMNNLTCLWVGDNSLTGLLPSELGILTSMTELNIAGNYVSGLVPSELGLLTELTDLFLYENTLTGTLPTELGLITSLTWVDLEINTLSGSLPSEVGLLKNLKELWLNNNTLNGFLPSELGLMTSSMADLDISWNSLSGSLPSQLGLLTNMRVLFLKGNSLNGSLPTEFALITSLTWVDLEVNTLSGSLPSELGLLTNMEILSLSNNYISGFICSEIGEMTSLVELTLAGNFLAGTLPSELGSLTLLEWLDLSKLRNVSGSIPSEFTLLTSLHYLDLTGTSLAGTIPDVLCNLRSPSCTFSGRRGDSRGCTLAFDCTSVLCGCDCPCGNVIKPSSLGMRTLSCVQWQLLSLLLLTTATSIL